jgi:hypothetical protein
MVLPLLVERVCLVLFAEEALELLSDAATRIIHEQSMMRKKR